MRCLLSIGLLLCLAAAAPADVTYEVTVDTTSLIGSTGFLDFQFNPGPLGSQAATGEIQNFILIPGSLAGAPDPMGDVMGALPGTVSIGNSTGFNDYFQQVMFGPQIMFDLFLTGPALSAPDGVSASGSSFGFSMFANDGVTPLLTTNPDGFALIVDVNLTGITHQFTFPSDLNGGPPAVSATIVPEPRAAILLLSVAAILGFRLRLASRRLSGV